MQTSTPTRLSALLASAGVTLTLLVLVSGLARPTDATLHLAAQAACHCKLPA